MKYTVAVRELCEFTAKQGDLDLRFTPSPTAEEGIAGHAVVTSRRGRGYRAELSLSQEFGPLLVRGRADGYDPERHQLEEIKTYSGRLSALPDNRRQLHWAQAKIYGWMVCCELQLAEINLALVYYNITSQHETVLHELHSAASLRQFFEIHCTRFLRWAEQELAHRSARDQALTSLAFPHPGYRPGQRQLAEAVYKAAGTGRCLIAQAPTGIGKTIATLFPLLKACPTKVLDKIFFLTAKTSGRRLALDALALLRHSAPQLPLRVLEMTGRDKACEYPERACHGESCPLARGFYDRLPQARQAALANGCLDKNALRAIALQHQVCPYYLSQEMIRWSDVVVGDYNYYFDSSALLYGLTVANQWQVGVLVDEAHNMLARARSMYSAELDQAVFASVRKAAPAALRKKLDRLNRSWNELHRTQHARYQVYPEPPDKFRLALQQAVSAMTDYLAEHPAAAEEKLQRFYFDAIHYSRLLDAFDEHSLFDITLESIPASSRTRSVLCLRNIVPAPFLQARYAAAHTTVLFSATLHPWRFYSDTLGLPENTAWLDVQSPFLAEQLSVRVARHISTRYQHRARSLAPIADLIARQYQSLPGNYLAFFSSFDYLEKVLTLFAARYPHIPLWKQSPGMAETEREQFLACFTPASLGIGFAVLGGAFAEGIDLPGKRLIGAFIATLGLPQINPINEQVNLRMSALFGNGYDYTYLYPGIQKVVQAAGRVIRTTSDRGVIHLIDDRYARAEVLRLLPPWWNIENPDAAGAA
ncbi:MAG: ATP-dependent DNA helicase [Pseudomonadota bacterium]